MFMVAASISSGIQMKNFTRYVLKSDFFFSSSSGRLDIILCVCPDIILNRQTMRYEIFIEVLVF